LYALEWLFTALFTIEYAVRLSCVKRPLRYALSLFGIIDLLSILPTCLAILLPELHFLIDVRLLRMLRVFRVMKLPGYFDESQVLLQALRNSRHKIMVFLGVVLIMSVILGTIMYVIEGPDNGFTSIPIGKYWSSVTLTTTGYGDIHPKTPMGQLITSCAMLLGYGIIALPTGIVGVELAMTMMKGTPTTRTCTNCLTEGHEADSLFYKHCGGHSRAGPAGGNQSAHGTQCAARSAKKIELRSFPPGLFCGLAFDAEHRQYCRRTNLTKYNRRVVCH
jgi:voltage-gated potassium channel